MENSIMGTVVTAKVTDENDDAYFVQVNGQTLWSINRNQKSRCILVVSMKALSMRMKTIKLK